MDRQYFLLENNKYKQIPYSETIDLIRGKSDVKIFERVDLEYKPLNYKLVDDLEIDGQIVNSYLDTKDVKIYLLKSGKTLKRYDVGFNGVKIISSIVSKLPGFLNSVVDSKYLIYDSFDSTDFTSKSIDQIKCMLYELIMAIYQLHKRGISHNNLNLSSVGFVNNKLVVSNYELSTFNYESSKDIDSIVSILRSWLSINELEDTDINNFLQLYEDGHFIRITRMLQHAMFQEKIISENISLISVRANDIYYQLPYIEVDRETQIKVSNLLKTKLERSLRQCFSIELLLQTGVYSLELSDQLITGKLSSDNLSDQDVSKLIEYLTQIEVYGSAAHLAKYLCGDGVYSSLLSLYSLFEINQVIFAELSAFWTSKLTGAELTTELENIDSDVSENYVKQLKISQPVVSGLTRDELNSL